MTGGCFNLDVGAFNLRNHGGYLHFYCPGHPPAWQNGYAALQRHLMSVRLGRWLDQDEKVLFLNGDRTDVQPENLELVAAAELRAHTFARISVSYHLAPVLAATPRRCN